MAPVLNDELEGEAPILRVVLLTDDGSLEDTGEEYDVFDFGGEVPSAGDWIVRPEVPSGQDQDLPENRRIWEVVRRVFQAKDHGGEYIVLVVHERPVRDSEAAIL